ncbi:hypothetical protein SISNIDRAFT_410929 [Sistotremastrum niveocremeum HHB9708]|uniref:Uncharacterized protein n=1 Tax=Sistotremastrum niveocremeum HHB9708 TaxID=1314777 RepID=A0A164V489_9AGAM|nr:hypothetical protein SISNIDRAFT_410929 [Sistotremastrum niveocremeum HHB9708]
MQLTSRISFLAIITAALFASNAVAYNPVGQSCPKQGDEGCSQDASLNGGNAFIYECGPSNTFVYVAGCRCPTCCEATTSGAFCT